MNLFDITEEQIEFRGQIDTSLAHVIGSKTEDLHFLPDLKGGFQKDSRRNFSEREKWALIEEDGNATNAQKIDVKGTHYENQTPAEIAMSIMPLLGL